MIKFIIYGVIFLVLVYLSRNYVRGWIMEFVAKRRRKTEPLPEVSTELIYTPIISSRTFQFAIEITEVGDGKAVISVVKAR